VGIGLEGDLRGSDERSRALFSYVDLKARVRKDHPLRSIRVVVNQALGVTEADFAALYSRTGRPSIPSEKLLRAMLLQAFHSIRSERQPMERLEFDLLFRWFDGLGIDDPAWDHSTFSKNRDWLLESAVAGRLLNAILAQPRVKRLLSTEHFSVDGTLIQAWASMKSFKPVEGPDDHGPPSGGRNAEANFRGETRSNATHASTTDPDAKHYRKGPGMEARLCFLGHALMENRSGLLVSACLTQANGHAERLAALAMIEARANRPVALTLAADKGYDAADFVNELRGRTCGPTSPEHDPPRALGHRRANDMPPRLCGEPTGAQAHRGGFRLDEDGRGDAPADAARRRPGGMGLHLRGCGLQPGLPAAPAGGAGLMAKVPAFAKAFVGR
jgi:transposase